MRADRESKTGKRMWDYIQRQLRDVHAGGARVFIRKAQKFIRIVLAMPFILLAVLFVRALRPIILVRFGRLHTSRIGEFISRTELYLCERDAGMHPQKSVDLFYHGAIVSNRYLKSMYERSGKIRILRFVGAVDRLNRKIPGSSSRHVVSLSSVRDTHGLMKRFSPHITFSEEEEYEGQIALRRMGVPEGGDFICFFARDSRYLESVDENHNWGYHSFLNSNIENYVQAAEELARRGHHMIRMGSVVEERLQSSNANIIDYPNLGRSEFLDVYLSATCRLFLCGTSGIHWLPMMFRRPRVQVNFIPLERVQAWIPQDLMIPKKLWLREEKRFLSFREILDSGVGRLQRSEQYEKLGLEIVENTAQEITDVAIEMEERLNGTGETNEEDEELQRRFWSLFRRSDLNQMFLSRIGTKFLRQNRALLE